MPASIHSLCWLDSSSVTNCIQPAEKFSLLRAFLSVAGLNSCVISAAWLHFLHADGKVLKMSKHLYLQKEKPLGLFSRSSVVLCSRWCVSCFSSCVHTLCSASSALGVEHKRLHKPQGHLDAEVFMVSCLSWGHSSIPRLPTVGCLLLWQLPVMLVWLKKIRGLSSSSLKNHEEAGWSSS